jgi:butyryl-CoA dehydrogenase
VHKIGWKGLPSVILALGEAGDCRGWLVGEPGRGLAHMFQMMNEARIMVGANGVATASVAYLESLAYARERPQGRPLADRNPLSPQVPIVEHADVRRMLLRQKAIVEGGLALVLEAAMQADLAHHAESPEARRRAQLLLDLLTRGRRASRRRGGSSPTCCPCRSTAGTATRASTCPRRGCATRS